MSAVHNDKVASNAACKRDKAAAELLLGVSRNRGPYFSTLDSKILIIRTPN